MTLDKIDQEILRILQLDGRISNHNLAMAVSLSPSACHRRVRLLERAGIIRGYAAQVAALPDAEAVVVIVQVTLERQTQEYLRRFEVAVRQHPQISECCLVSGAVDFMIRVTVASPGDYEEFHAQVLSRLPGVERIQSSMKIRNTLRPGLGRAA